MLRLFQSRVEFLCIYFFANISIVQTHSHKYLFDCFHLAFRASYRVSCFLIWINLKKYIFLKEKKPSCHNRKGRRLQFWAENIRKIKKFLGNGKIISKSFSEGRLDVFWISCIFLGSWKNILEAQLAQIALAKSFVFFVPLLWPFKKNFFD